MPQTATTALDSLRCAGQDPGDPLIECEHLTRLEIEVANGRTIEKRRTEEADLLAATGVAHERAYLASLRAADKDVLEISASKSGEAWKEAADRTRRAMEAGAEVVFQGTFLTEDWRIADFLVRVDARSALGSWGYEAWDAKLARTPKPSHLLQLAYYTEQVAAIQGVEPERMGLVLGSGAQVWFRPAEFIYYYRAVRRGFLQALNELTGVTPYPVHHCTLCGYAEHCRSWWQSTDHLSLVAGIRRTQVERLQEIGVHTCTELAGLGDTPIAIGDAAFTKIRQQAALQTRFRRSGAHSYELLPPAEENGFRLRLPDRR